jgi:tetratricopeptide (TPR) repeat protein
MKKLIYLFSLSLATATLADESSIKKALNDALYTETVTRNPLVAALQYAKVVESFRADGAPADQRAHASAALFRLAEIRDDQGREEEAQKHYREFLDLFPNQEPQADLARKKLGITGPEPRQKLAEITEEEDRELTENVSRKRWKFTSRLKPDELLLTTFQVKHHEGYANEGLPPAFEVKTLHYAPSGQITNGFSHTRVDWPQEVLTKQHEQRKQEKIKDTYRPTDRRNFISGFGQTYVVPEDINYSGGGWGDTSMAFFFTNKHFTRDKPFTDYKEVKPTKWLTVKLSTQLVSVKRASNLVKALNIDRPEMGKEAWSLTLPPSPSELEKQNKGE